MPVLQWKRYWRSVAFRIGDSEQRLVLTPAVLNHLAKYQQSDKNLSEAGDQLFARFKGSRFVWSGPRGRERLIGDTQHSPSCHPVKESLERIHIVYCWDRSVPARSVRGAVRRSRRNSYSLE